MEVKIHVFCFQHHKFTFCIHSPQSIPIPQAQMGLRDATGCCAKRIMEVQPDFKSQKSLVQETIEAAGHICLVLLKFHCKLNIIEYFWGCVKWYLQECCDYTFTTLKENMPSALASRLCECHSHPKMAEPHVPMGGCLSEWPWSSRSSTSCLGIQFVTLQISLSHS
jgi:hypothetical protein